MNSLLAPTAYQFANQFAPNPTNVTGVEVSYDAFSWFPPEDGTMYSCLKSGRMWMYSSQANAFRQVLPFVRTDNGLTGVQMSNDGGNLKATLPTGATGGQVNLFDMMRADSTGVTFPALSGMSFYESSAYINRNTGKLESSPIIFQNLTYDTTITNTAQPTVIGAFTHSNDSADSALFEYHVQLQFYHANQYEVSAAVRIHRDNTYYVYQESATVSSQTGGFQQLSLHGRQALLPNEQFRVYVWPTVSGVDVRKYSGKTWVSTNPPVDPALNPSEMQAW